MTVVNALIADVIGQFRWATDASTLGWAPGTRAARTLPTTLGNGQPFLLQAVDADGTARYAQALGCVTLTVFND